jgi:hypothetical protein
VVLYPVVEGRVLEDAAVSTSEADLPAAVARLSWDDRGGDSDWPWLLGWLASPRGRGAYVPLLSDEDRATLVGRLLIPLAVTHNSRGGA